MINDLVTTITTIIEGVFSWISTLMSSVVSIFYTPGTGSASGSFTFVGVLLLVSFCLSMVWVIINFVKGLVKRA